jgi:CHAD domain-containing protein
MSQATYQMIGPATPVGAAAATILSTAVQPVFDLERAAASGTDMDAVHDMRVASRRTREALAVFGHLYRSPARREMLGAVRQVTRALGPLRDADVHLGHFADLFARSSGDEERVALAYLIGYQQAERARRLERTVTDLGALSLAERRPRILRSMHDFKQSADIGKPFGWLAHDTLEQRLDTFLSFLPEALRETAAESQHRMRIAGKHLRYAVETFRPCFDPESYASVRKTLVAYQDVLGELHDRDIFIAFVRQARLEGEAARSGVPATGLLRVEQLLRLERGMLYLEFRAHVDAYPGPALRAAVVGALVEGPKRHSVESEAPAPSETPSDPAPSPASEPAGPETPDDRDATPPGAIAVRERASVSPRPPAVTTLAEPGAT